MKKLIFIALIATVFMVSNTKAEETILIKSEDNSKTRRFNNLLLQTKCVDGYLFAVVRNSHFVTTTQVYRQGFETDNYIPQPVMCK